MAYPTLRRSARLSRNLCLGLAAVTLVVAPASAARASERRQTAIVKLVQKARAAIVNIHGQKTLAPGDDAYRRGEGPQNVNGMGTGVIIDERGYILTNHHVVDGVREIRVTLADENPLVGQLVAHDSKTDLAIIKINVSRKLPVIDVGTSADLMIGEPTVAIGNAYGYEHTVTCGIVSALHRAVQVSDSQKYRDLIQTDAAINPGNSGGPLLNADGQMIGINVAVRQGAQAIGFAIPVDLAMSVAATLMGVQRTKLDNTWHGIVSKPAATPDESDRLVVGQVAEESPAAQCGLQPGDVITTVGDCHVERALDLERALLGRRAGEEVEVSVHRNSKPVKVSLVLAAAPKQKVSDADRAWEVIGLRLEPVSQREFKEYKTHYHGGLRVTEVRPGSPAARQSIRRGDILVGMHVWETVSLDNVDYILKRPDVATLDPLKFYILRDEGDYYGTYYGHLSVSLRR
jgi:serine protease Do